MDDSPRSRVILHPPSLVKTVVGEDVRISCSGYGAAPLYIQWKVFEKGKWRLLDEDSTTHFFLNRTLNGNGTLKPGSDVFQAPRRGTSSSKGHSCCSKLNSRIQLRNIR